MFNQVPKSLRIPTVIRQSDIRSRGESASASFEQGMDTMTGIFSNFAAGLAAEHYDKKAGLGTVDKETVDKYNEAGVPFIWEQVKHLTPSQFELQAREYVEDNLRGERINQEYGATNTVAGLAPELINPANFIPAARLASVLGKAGGATLRADPINLALAKGQRFKASALTYKKYAKEAFLGNAAVEPLYYMDAQYSGQHYGVEDAAMNTLLGTGVGVGFFGTVSAGLTFRQGTRTNLQVQMFEDMYHFMETGNLEGAANVLFRNDPKFRKQLEKVSSLRDVLEEAYQGTGNLNLSSLSDDQLRTLKSSVEAYFNKGFEISLNRTMSEMLAEEVKNNPKISVPELSTKYREQYIRIFDALRSEDFSKLSEVDRGVLVKVLKNPDLFDQSSAARFESRKAETDFDIFQRPISVGVRSDLDAAFGPDFVVQSPNADHLYNRFKTALESLRKAGKHVEANRLSEITEDLEGFVESPTDFKSLSFLTREITNAEYSAGIITDAQRPQTPIRPFTGDFDVDKRGFWGEQVRMFRSGDAPLTPKEGYVYRGVTQEGAGYSIDNEGNLIIRPRSDEMFTRAVGEEKGRGSSYSSDPSEAAHYAMFNNLQEYRVRQEESLGGIVYDPSDDLLPPVVLEIKAEALQKNPALKQVLEGTETESRVVHTEELKLSKDDFKEYQLDSDLHSDFLSAPEEGVLGDVVLESKSFTPLRVDQLDPEKIGYMAEAYDEAYYILNLLHENKVKTLEELVDKGKMTAGERTKILKRFNKLYMRAYAKEVKLASEVINNIFGREIPIRKVSKDTKLSTLGYVGFLDDRIHINRAEVIIANASSVFEIIVHEAGHVLKNIDPDSWNQIDSLIRDNPDLYTAMIDHIHFKRKYSMDKAEQEIPSVALEWAITKRAFWQELSKANKPLFEKLKDSLTEIFIRLQELFKAQGLRSIFNDAELRKLLRPDVTPDELAQAIARVINESREKRFGANKIFKAVEAVRANVTRIANTEPIAGPTYTERFIEENTPRDKIVDDNEFLAVDYVDSFLGRVATVLGKNKNDVRDLLELLVTPELKLADEPELIDYSDFKSRVQKITSTILDEEGTVYDPLVEADYEALYENLRQLLQNKSEEGLIISRNADLYRRIQRRKATDPEGVDGLSAEQFEILVYHEEQAATVINNAMKREMLVEELAKVETNKGKIAVLRSILDGQERAGTPAKAGLEYEMLAEAQEAVTPLLDVLYRHGLQDLFIPDTTLGMFSKQDNRREYEMFGKRRIERSMEFHRQLHKALLKRELPEEWSDKPPLVELFDVLQATELHVLKKLNKAGLRISKLSDFGGVSQRWDPAIIYDMGLDAFKARMLGVMDVEATSRALGDVLYVNGRPEPFDVNKFIDQWYESLDPSRRVEDDVQVFDLENNFAGRLVRLKPDYATETLIEFSGYENMGLLMIQQIQRLASVAHMAKVAGTKPNELLSGVLKGIGKGEGSKSAKATIDAMTGILENPVDVALAKQADVVKKLSNILFMSGAGISSLTDIPLAASTLEVQGVRFGENNATFLQAWRDAVARRFGNDRAKMKDYWLGAGAGLDILNNSVIKRFTNTDLGSNFLDKANKVVFRVNGLEPLTLIHQEMYVDMITRGMAMELGALNPESAHVSHLRNFGFKDAEIVALKESIKADPNGVLRIVPNNVKSKQLATKLRTYITKYMRQAVFMPDQGTRAQLVLGFRRGTPAGEMAYIATQYMPFMAGMSKLLYRRFIRGNYGVGSPDMMYKMAHLVSYLGGAMAFGYMVTAIKDFIRGKEPIGLDGLTAFDVSRIVQQSGVLGVLEIPLDVKDWGPLSALAPLPSTVFGIGIDTFEGDLDGVADGIGALTGGQILGPPQWLHGMIGESMAQTLNEMQLDLLDYNNQ